MDKEKLEQLPAPVLLQIIQAQIDVKKAKKDIDKITTIFSGLALQILNAKGIRILLNKTEGIAGKPEGYLITAPFTSGVLEVYWKSQTKSAGKLPLLTLLTEMLSATYANALEFQMVEESIENSLNGFDIVNSKGELIYVNKAYIKMWGYDSREEILKTSPADHCADPAIPIKIITELKERGETFIDFLAKRKDGSTFNVLMWARLAYAPDGSEINPTSSIDITSMKNIENELRESLRSRDEFLSVVSHELRTPLTTLKLNSQLRTRNLKKGMNENFSIDKLGKLFSHDNKQIDRISRLIDDMLDIARITTGKLELKSEKFNFCDMVADVIEVQRAHFHESNVSIDFFCSENVTGHWDRFRLEQVLNNLLSNALKYGERKPVKVEVSQDNNMVIMKVIDQGVGVAKDNQRRIFDRFERATPSKEISGLGLGLSITKHIVEKHHGTIEIISAVDMGSTFIVRLPKN